jgi:hypothetical protein
MLGMRTANAPRRAPHGSLAVLVSLLVLWSCWLLWFVLAPDRNADGRCEGLGFGCTLTPRDAAEFAGILVVAPVSVLVLIVTGVVRLVRIRRGSPRTVWDLVLGMLLAAAVVAWVAGSVAGSL